MIRLVICVVSWSLVATHDVDKDAVAGALVTAAAGATVAPGGAIDAYDSRLAGCDLVDDFRGGEAEVDGAGSEDLDGRTRRERGVATHAHGHLAPQHAPRRPLRANSDFERPLNGR